MADKKEQDISAFTGYAKNQGVEESQATALFYAARGSVVKETGGDVDKLTGEEFGMLWGKYKELIKGVTNKKDEPASKKKESLPESLDNNSNVLFLLGLYDEDYSVFITVETSIANSYTVNAYTGEGELLSTSDINNYDNDEWISPTDTQIKDSLEKEVLCFLDEFSNPYYEVFINDLNIPAI